MPQIKIKVKSDYKVITEHAKKLEKLYNEDPYLSLIEIIVLQANLKECKRRIRVMSN